jgi:hypothetical protein
VVLLHRQSIRGDHGPDFPDLIWLRHPAFALQVDHIVNARPYEEVMTAPHSLDKPEMLEQPAEVIEIDVGI